jgi:hypothetical protein
MGDESVIEKGSKIERSMNEIATVSVASRRLYFWVPFGAQIFLAIAIWTTIGYFHKAPTLAYISVLFAWGPSILAIYLLVLAIGALIAHSTILIIHFAGIFYLVGFHQLSNPTIWDGLYFSIVTWTTLGYGDLTPIAELRMLAALEAMFGFVFFGLVVALLSASFKKQ